MKKTDNIVFIGLIVLLSSGCTEQQGPAEQAEGKIDTMSSERKAAIQKTKPGLASKIEEAGEKSKE